MTTRAYHHGNLRAALVEAAVAGVRERGPEALALRELARTVGVSHNAAYRHFGDRDELVAAVALEGMGGLSRYLDRSLAAVDADEQARPADPVRRARRRLGEVGRAYVAFALAEPGLFRVAFAAYPGLPSPEELAAQGAPDPFSALVGCLDDLVTVGWLSPAARPDAELACWSAVHGFAVLCLDGPLRELPPTARDLAVDRMLEMLDRSAAASVGVSWTGPPDPSPSSPPPADRPPA